MRFWAEFFCFRFKKTPFTFENAPFCAHKFHNVSITQFWSVTESKKHIMDHNLWCLDYGVYKLKQLRSFSNKMVPMIFRLLLIKTEISIRSQDIFLCLIPIIFDRKQIISDQKRINEQIDSVQKDWSPYLIDYRSVWIWFLLIIFEFKQPKKRCFIQKLVKYWLNQIFLY